MIRTRKIKSLIRILARFLNNSINWAILAGTIGMVSGIYLFNPGNSNYGELKLDKRHLIDELLRNRIGCLDSAIKHVDSGRSWAIQTAELKRIILATKREQYVYDNGNGDTSLFYFNKFILIKASDYAAGIDTGKWYNSKNECYKQVKAEFEDTCRACAIYPAGVPTTLRLVKYKYENSIDFFKEYPQFGFWFVFSIIQFVLWSMIIPFLTGLVIKVNRKFPSKSKLIPGWYVVKYTALPFMFMVLFCLLFYYVILGKWVVKDDYFLSYFQYRMYLCCVIGYLVAISCFGTHIALVRKLNYCCRNMKSGSAAEELKEAYPTFKASFDNSFLCSALILSFCVLWTGVLVNAVNSMEAFRFYHILSGKDFIPNDFVYIQGLLYTLILLIFYIPAKFKFNGLTRDHFSVHLAEGEPSSIRTLSAALSESLGTVLITVSPLLASLVHTLLGIAAKG